VKFTNAFQLFFSTSNTTSVEKAAEKTVPLPLFDYYFNDFRNSSCHEPAPQQA